MKKIKTILFNKKINYYKFLIVRNVKIHYFIQTQLKFTHVQLFRSDYQVGVLS